eukprot:TRINITY_DN25062_c0_g1_i1.p2 TRINITY_DN25062_c0_g1~~TRINITY_DN25062_c0_g1_i1.p2  ORF type:complete len:195 (+),score=39.56 TRINITY_DN25062_c0_g1_i1:50-586(+)
MCIRDRIQYTSQSSRNYAIMAFRDAFYNFSMTYYPILRADPSFNTLLNNTLTVTWTPSEFAYRSSLYKSRTGRDAYDDIWYNSGTAFLRKDFNTAGWNLGNIFLSLKAVNALEPRQKEAVLKSLLFPDKGFIPAWTDEYYDDRVKRNAVNGGKMLAKDLVKKWEEDTERESLYIDPNY